ncbi:Nitrous oxide reductase maturation protein NosF (ATPase) [Thioalkalivibrio nitratireducens DSM 14787]|uniref:Nitrous oxide reductase maturation protein NosF (ATPase) n=1 Tax=Thioalkalivibrio nitratireducens (strain DSM 14787 / UNIQEM 213 / ALEN2) TaxID=1255043 RepID=L0DWA7_THIND|nr:ABC transporter ATP-binding protein [Thioalkalivibrio nitratireducens]AGA33302.1 Nitrous oxide reductase maturation protein NosF (ATPase) [Thioalkalivibrio nitratireducens DSM 14787]
MSAIPAVEFRAVTRRYGRLAALDGMNWSLREGEVVGLLGHNGAGKTTCMKLVLGVAKPTTGEVRVHGQPPTGRHAHALRQRLGYLPENVSFYPQMTGREVLRYFARLKRVPPARCDTLLERVGLQAAAKRRVGTYSKGMRQRLGLAQALLGAPRLLLFDEPTVGLDPIATRDFYRTVDDLRRQGTTIVLCSHVLPGIEPHIDRAAILREGQLLAYGTLEELRAQAALPLRIRVRGSWRRPEVDEALTGMGITIRGTEPDEAELSGPPTAKMRTLEVLLGASGVEDIDVMHPSLETLYAHISLGEDR